MCPGQLVGDLGWGHEEGALAHWPSQRREPCVQGGLRPRSLPGQCWPVLPAPAGAPCQCGWVDTGTDWAGGRLQAWWAVRTPDALPCAWADRVGMSQGTAAKAGHGLPHGAAESAVGGGGGRGPGIPGTTRWARLRGQRLLQPSRCGWPGVRGRGCDGGPWGTGLLTSPGGPGDKGLDRLGLRWLLVRGDLGPWPSCQDSGGGVPPSQGHGHL